MQDSQKVNLQIEFAVRKANVMLALILRELEYKSKNVMLKFYQALLRPH